MTGKVVPFRRQMDRAKAQAIIREAAEDTSRVFITRHATKRMRQRRINRTQVFACLRLGVMTEGPAPELLGGWRCTMDRLAAGDQVRAVVVIDPASSLIVVTVI
jgi:hypothetical protein